MDLKAASVLMRHCSVKHNWELAGMAVSRANHFCIAAFQSETTWARVQKKQIWYSIYMTCEIEK